MQKRLPRGAGILLPISSLPSQYGIGSLGNNAFRFVDYLKAAGQRYWQVLPIGPTSYGDSPYQSFSAFAGNPYFIDLDKLSEQGLLTEEELEAEQSSPGWISYERLYRTRFLVLRCAASRFSDTEEFLSFCEKESFWLEDYALYMAIKGQNGEAEWTKWKTSLRDREKKSLQMALESLRDEIRFWKFCQYHFFCQWDALKQYANKQGIWLVGDIPIYVAQDSADVWAHRDLFELDEEGNPVNVAGVPPDYFCAEGQRWGNPLYRYERMQEDGFAWWRQRASMCARLFDVIRIDHFIGLSRYYAIPASCETAKVGEWRKGPEKTLTDVLDSAAGEVRIIAENLGVLHPSVERLLKKTGYPGMKILQFAFDGDPQNDYLPHNYTQNCVVYGGTHDNETIVGYLKKLRSKQRQYIKAYLNVRRIADIPRAMLRAAYASVADVAIFQMQDILELDNSARMNTPSTLGGNWQWQLQSEQLNYETARNLQQLVRLYGRERNEYDDI